MIQSVQTMDSIWGQALGQKYPVLLRPSPVILKFRKH